MRLGKLLLLIVVVWSSFWAEALALEPVAYGPPSYKYFYRELAKRLALDLKRKLGPRTSALTLVVSSFVSEDDFTKSDPFGRILAELLSEELVSLGVTVLEPRITKELAILPKEGEFVLSRDPSQLKSLELNINAVVTGIVSRHPDRTIVQVKVVSLANLKVLAVASVEILGRNTPTVYDYLPGL